MPKIVNLPLGENWVCLCGRSNNAPHCDGSHEGSAVRPKKVNMTQAGEVAVCGCNRSGNEPFCDGTHKSIT